MRILTAIGAGTILLSASADAAPKRAAMPVAKPKPAAPSAQLNDLKCFVVLSSAEENAPEADKKDINVAAVFFLGKLFGRVPDTNIEKLIDANQKSLETMDMKAEAERCSIESETLMK